ncbi:MAG: sensor histidine kinase, partial [Candidatus Saccharimonadales bacterium]
MIDVVAISLENDMDLVLAHKRSMKVAEKLGLTTATQTTFATAVSEIARTVIEHTDNGNLIIG